MDILKIIAVILFLGLFCKCDEVKIEESLFENGQIQTIRSFRNGLIEGVCEDFYKGGNVKLHVAIENGKGYGEKYYIDGSILSQGEFIVTKHLGKQVVTEFGLHKFYYKNGAIGAQVNYDTLKLHGPFKLYYENGENYLTAFYSNGYPDSVWRFYSINKELSKEVVYNNGEIISETEYIKCVDTPNIQFLSDL